MHARIIYFRLSRAATGPNHKDSNTKNNLCNIHYQTEGYRIRLRPVRIDDAAFIVWLRNLDHVKGSVGDSAANTADQETWLKNYFEREGDYYFIVETQAEYPWAHMAFTMSRATAPSKDGKLCVRR